MLPCIYTCIFVSLYGGMYVYLHYRERKQIGGASNWEALDPL